MASVPSAAAVGTSSVATHGAVGPASLIPDSSPVPQAQPRPPRDLLVSPRDLRSADPFRLKALLAPLHAALDASVRSPANPAAGCALLGPRPRLAPKANHRH